MMPFELYIQFYEHGRQVRERIKSIEASYPPAKRQRVELPVEEETNVEYETVSWLYYVTVRLTEAK